MITIVDSKVANIGSVQAALRRIGAPYRIAQDPGMVRDAAALLLPGVGAFADAMAALRAAGFIEPIRAAAASGTPVIGVCLGMQLLATESEEFGRHEGLGLIRGRVRRLAPAQAGERVPNIGWCDVSPSPASSLYREIKPGTAFYFVHSYHLACDDPADVAAGMRFGGGQITVAVEHANIHGAQFHPEKSQDAGLTVLAAFATLVARRVQHAA
jgi:imidazole glycerol-phosphate synthase subunit HisH